MKLAGNLDVSRETIERLERFSELLKKWNKTVNLVSKTTLEHIWNRHIVDSAQLFDLATADSNSWADLGSGGGLPGLVIAIIALEKRPGLRVAMIESDQRKCVFLRSVGVELGLNTNVISTRIDAAPRMRADILSARALAPLSQLLNFAALHLDRDGCGLFPKGASFQQEIDEARLNWEFDVEAVPSITDKDARILAVRNIRRV